MDHNYINQFDLVDQYLLGKLAPEEVEQFEAHFVDCPECIEQLNTSENFIQDLRRMASKDASLANGRRPGQPGPWLLGSRLSGAPLKMVAGCLILIGGLCVFLVVKRIEHLKDEVNQARAVSSALDLRYQDELRSASDSERTSRESEQALNDRVGELEAELKTEQEQNKSSLGQAGTHAPPQINLAIHVLKAVRGASDSGPETEIALTPSTSTYVISIPLQGETKSRDYRVTIDNIHGKHLWNRNGFSPDKYGSLNAGLSANFLPPGSYQLTVQALGDSGQWTTLGVYPFRLTRHN